MFGLNENDSGQLVYLSLLLVLLLASLGIGRGRGSGMFRQLGVWALIGVALVVLYAYRAPLLRVAAPVIQELAPARVVEVVGPAGERELVVTRGNDGHFHLDAKANDADVRFLVDTGATTTALTWDDARRAGIDVETLGFNRPVQTANGLAYYAGATLDSLTIGPYRMASVPVAVMPANAMDTSLLGMSTIDRFTTWRMEGDRMVLTP
jgi:aspartyl protease family protein